MKVDSWLDPSVTAIYPGLEIVKMADIKNSEIPRLDSYEKGASDAFWAKFPKRALPKKAETKMNILKLRKMVLKASEKMSKPERRRANKIIKDLRVGADAYQRKVLPPITTENSKSAFEHGALLTDTVATWIKKGFMAGPFDTPPLPGFRENPLGAMARNGKVRPILNMSGPAGRSFNDNVKEEELEKLHMGTAKQFSYLLREAGKGACFSKFDIRDAYKLVPAKVEDYRLQGFKWLNKYFVEVMMSFGGKPSPCNFDRLGKTKDLLACIQSGTPRYLVPRALDDTPCVAPEGSDMINRFSVEMKKVCEEANIPLVENCPQSEKAFELVTVNDLAQMSPLLKFHKRTGNTFLKSFGGSTNLLKLMPQKLKEDLSVIAKVAEHSINGLPIADRPVKPPLTALYFYTDAAAQAFL